jgi:hypothetical protein
MEEDYYFVDTRNADHRTTSGGGRPSGRPMGQTIIAPGSGTRSYPMQQPQQVYYAQPNQLLAPGSTSPLFGRVTTGQLIDLVAQIFAALMPLPAAPTSTADTHTDVGNLMLYQGALAEYAKRDEQVRTLGNLVTKLVG